MVGSGHSVTPATGVLPSDEKLRRFARERGYPICVMDAVLEVCLLTEIDSDHPFAGPIIESYFEVAKPLEELGSQDPFISRHLSMRPAMTALLAEYKPGAQLHKSRASSSASPFDTEQKNEIVACLLNFDRAETAQLKGLFLLLGACLGVAGPRARRSLRMFATELRCACDSPDTPPRQKVLDVLPTPSGSLGDYLSALKDCARGLKEKYGDTRLELMRLISKLMKEEPGRLLLHRKHGLRRVRVRLGDCSVEEEGVQIDVVEYPEGGAVLVDPMAVPVVEVESSTVWGGEAASDDLVEARIRLSKAWCASMQNLTAVSVSVFNPVEKALLQAHCEHLKAAELDEVERALVLISLLGYRQSYDLHCSDDGEWSFYRVLTMYDDSYREQLRRELSIESSSESMSFDLPIPPGLLTDQGQFGLRTIMGMKEAKRDEQLSLALERIRQSSPTLFRVTKQRVERNFRNEVFVRTESGLTAWQLAGREHEGGPVLAYYTMPSHAQLAARFMEVTQPFTGAWQERKWRPSRDLGVSLVERAVPVVTALKQRVKRCPPSLPLEEFHNRYTRYTLLLLMFATGHRPVVDPFASLGDISDDRFWVRIDDKASTSAHQSRLVALAAMARKQIGLYLNYLQVLARYVRSELRLSYLASPLQAMLSAPETQELPLFFLLSDAASKRRDVIPIRPSNLWPSSIDVTKLPANLGRQCLAEWLWNSGVGEAGVELHLGHLEIIQHPYSDRSNLVPSEQHAALAESVEDFLKVLGFENLSHPSLPRHTYAASGVENPSTAFVPRPFGAAIRAQMRAKEAQIRRQRISEIAHRGAAHLREVLADSDDTPAASGAAELFEQTVVELAELESVRREPLAKAICDVLGDSPETSALYQECRFRRPLDPEDPPFGADIISQYNALLRARNRFIESLTVEAKQSVAKQLARILVSAALFGAFAREEGFPELISSVQVSSSPRVIHLRDWDWYPDPISEALILYFSKSKDPAAKRAVSEKSVIRQLEKVFKSIGFDFNPQQPYCELSELSMTACFFHLPGCLRGSVDGSRNQEGMPSGAIKRLATGESLIATSAGEAKATDSVSWASNLDGMETSGGWTINEFRRNWRSAIHEALEAQAQGHQRKRPATLKRLRHEVRRRFDTPEAGMVARALAGWADHLSVFGTVKATTPALATIDKYVGGVATAIMQVADPSDFLFHDEAEYEELYGLAMAVPTALSSDELSRELRNFHQFLVETWMVASPGWSLPRSNGASHPNSIDANLLTAKEYQHCLKLLVEGHPQDSRSSYLLASALLLAYRFGLRISEVMRLRRIDLQFIPDWSDIWVQVRPNVHGVLKTPAALRQVPSLGKLSEREVEILETVLGFSEDEFEHDTQVLLLPGQKGGRDALNQNWVRSRVHRVMREVSGEPRLHFHHLRHGWATRAMALLYDPQSHSVWSELRPALVDGLDENDIVGRLPGGSRLGSIRAIATALGHVSEDTFLSTYAHIWNLVIADRMSAIVPKMDDQAVSDLIGMSYDSVRQLRSRYRHYLTVEAGDLGGILRLSERSPFADSIEIQTRIYPEAVDLGDRKDATQFKVGFALTGRVLLVLSRCASDYSDCTKRLDVDETDLERVAKAAEQVEDASLMEAYRIGVNRRAREGQKTSLVKRDGGIPSARIKRLQAALTGLDREYSADEQQFLGLMNLAVKAWQSCFWRLNKPPVFHEAGALEDFMEGLHLLGYGAVNMKAVAKYPEYVLSEVKRTLEGLAIPLTQTSAHVGGRAVPASLRRSVFYLSIDKHPDPIKSMADLHHLFFCIAVKASASLK